ncbi:hypothetical protein THIARS_61079 [Thiomonas delicata]|uniref:Uncharacterized protein n=1 Tax=Thiomonas delicata TaxID=364030 RepID=A0A238D4Z5_THIDL|nr:hypothetical protein THIARS_61079 [Thiomonas delicata]
MGAGTRERTAALAPRRNTGRDDGNPHARVEPGAMIRARSVSIRNRSFDTKPHECVDTGAGAGSSRPELVFGMEVTMLTRTQHDAGGIEASLFFSACFS